MGISKWIMDFSGNEIVVGEELGDPIVGVEMSAERIQRVAREMHRLAQLPVTDDFEAVMAHLNGSGPEVFFNRAMTAEERERLWQTIGLSVLDRTSVE